MSILVFDWKFLIISENFRDVGNGYEIISGLNSSPDFEMFENLVGFTQFFDFGIDFFDLLFIAFYQTRPMENKRLFENSFVCAMIDSIDVRFGEECWWEMMLDEEWRENLTLFFGNFCWWNIFHLLEVFCFEINFYLSCFVYNFVGHLKKCIGILSKFNKTLGFDQKE